MHTKATEASQQQQAQKCFIRKESEENKAVKGQTYKTETRKTD